MTLYPILIAPHKALRRKAKPVAKIDKKTHTLLNDMVDTMYHARGIGLAAPQIGINKQLIVIHLEHEVGEPLKLINPELTQTSGDMDIKQEGCLSLPDQFADITRPVSCSVRYLDLAGESCTLDAQGLLARCLQHEIDHLKGKLFVDYLSPVRRNMILRRSAKQKKTSSHASHNA
ncbi:MAG: peptide deformylase [Pseudomonadota bacterium]